MKPSLAIIEPYFGTLPKWYGLFLLSQERNPDLTWLLFTDAEPPKAHPKNLVVHQLTLEGFNALCKAKLGFDPEITRGYKCCELKPAYGKIFEDFLAPYSHWGFGDSDVLYGDVSAFLTPEVLEDCDALTACRCSITGQFALFKNTGPFQHPYQFLADFEAKVREPEIQHLDEIVLDEALTAAGCRICRRQLQIHDIGSDEWQQWAEKLEMQERGHLNDFFWEGGRTLWKDGKIVHAATGKEAMFFHFHYWKYHWNLPRFPYWPGAIESVEISESGLKLGFRKTALCSRARFWCFYIAPMKFQAFVTRVARGLLRRIRR